MVVSHPMWFLGTEFRPSTRALYAFNCKAISSVFLKPKQISKNSLGFLGFELRSLYLALQELLAGELSSQPQPDI